MNHAVTPGHRILVCQGQWCRSRGSRESFIGWRDATRGQGVAVLGVSCLGQCLYGPLVVVYPEGIWLARQHARAVTRAARALAGHGEWPRVLWRMPLPPHPGEPT
jgi:(2Fe-2S) ferredoxin